MPNMLMKLFRALAVPAALATSAFADTWSSPVNVSQNTLYNRWASVRGDSEGWHYTYIQGSDADPETWRLQYRLQRPDGTWLDPVQVGDVHRSEESRMGRFSDGTLFVLFHGRTAGGTMEWYYSQKSNGVWSTPVLFTPDDGLSDLSTDSDRIFDVGTDDTIHLLSQHDNGSQYNMRYYSKARSGGIVDHGDVYPSGDYEVNGAVRVTGAGASQRVHFLVAGAGSRVEYWRCYYRRWNNPGWGPAIDLTALVPGFVGGAHAGGIVELPDGRLVACLAGGMAGSSWDVWLLFSSNNGDTWGSPMNLSQNAGLSRSPSITLDGNGDLIAAWEDDTSGVNQIYTRRYSQGSLSSAVLVVSARSYTVSTASYGAATRIACHAWWNGSDWEVVTSEYQAGGSVTGIVRDQYGLAVGGADVTADPGGYAGSSDGSGSYTIKGIPAGTYALTAAKTACKSQTKTGILIAANQTAACDFTLTRLALADFDGDVDVDQSDFGCLQACFGGVGPGSIQDDPVCTESDLNHDQLVNQDDFLLFYRCMSGPAVPPTPDCLP